MSASINTMTLSGRLGREPELKHAANDTTICTFSLAYNQYGDQDTGWINVVVFGKKAENAAQYLSKGDEAGITGELRYRAWEDKDSGKQRHDFELVADRVVFLRKKGESAGGDAAPVRPAPREEADDAPMDDPFA